MTEGIAVKAMAGVAASKRVLRIACMTGLVLASSACGIFGESRPEPPPYPAPVAQADFRPLWRTSRTGEGGLGFEAAASREGIWVPTRKDGLTLYARDSGRRLRHLSMKDELNAGVAVDHDSLGVVTRGGQVKVFDREGKEQWSVPLNGESVTTPVFNADLLLVRTVDGRLLALDRNDGSTIWTYQRPGAALVLRQNAPPVVAGGVIFLGMSGARLVALDPRLGVPVWETVIASPRGASELERLTDIVGRPGIAGEMVCGVAYQGRIACAQQRDGRVSWSREMGSSSGLAAEDSTVVSVDNSETIQGLKIGADPLWRQDGFVRRDMSAPAMADGRVVIGDRFGALHVLDAADGRPLARISGDDSPVVSRALIDEGVAYALDSKGTLTAVRLR